MPVAFEAFDDEPVVIITDLTDIATLDPASQTGDFVLPGHVGESLGDNEPIPVESLTHLEVLVYHYADGRELEVLHPVSLSVRFDGAEQITCSDRVGIVAPSGYLKCERFPKFGEPCFAGHAPINQFGD